MNHFFYSGDKTLEIDLKSRDKYAGIISKLIAQNSTKMITYHKDQILKYINSGMTVIALEKETFSGFIKINHWGYDENGRAYLELGSLIMAPEKRGHGIGTRLIKKAIMLARTKESKPLIFSVVRIFNKNSMALYDSLSAKRIGIPNLLNIPDKRQIPSIAYDLTNISF